MSEFNFDFSNIDLTNIDWSQLKVDIKLPEIPEFKSHFSETPSLDSDSWLSDPLTSGIFSFDPYPTSPLNRFRSHHDFLAGSHYLLTGGGGI